LERTPYGVIFARGDRDGRGAGALEAYSTGASIYPKRGRWLAFPTSAAPRFVSSGGKRHRLTPALWKKAGLEQRIGKLFFRQVRANLALLLVNRVSLSAKTGQAKALGKRKTRTRILSERAVPVFILIPFTRRAKRFDQRKIVEFYADRTPDALRRWYRDYDRRLP
jgi:hypothetical protein